MQVISILGASGFIDYHLLSFLEEIDRHEIRILVHREKPLLKGKGNVRFIEGSLLQVETLNQLLEPGCIKPCEAELVLIRTGYKAISLIVQNVLQTFWSL